MKKMLIATAVVLLFAATASAVVVRTRTLISTRLKSIEFVFEYDRETGALQEVNLRGRAIIFDDAGDRAGAHTVDAQWNDLPSAQRAQVKPFLQWVSKQINQSAVNENAEQTIPDTIP